MYFFNFRQHDAADMGKINYFSQNIDQIKQFSVKILTKNIRFINIMLQYYLMEDFIKQILQAQSRLADSLPQTKRYFYYSLKEELKKKPPLIVGIAGLRGVGKTISLLQNISEEGAFLRADDIGFRKYSLKDVVSYFYSNYNKKIFFIDEVHMYEKWEQEIKGLHDDYPDIKLVLSGSSSIKLRFSGADLSRRMKIIDAEPMFFSEFMEFKTGKKPPLFTLEEIIEKPLEASIEIEKTYPNIAHVLQEYIRLGGLPFYFKDPEVPPLIANGIKKMIYSDIPNAIPNLTLKILNRLEDVILFLAESPPGEFSYDTISSSIELSKGSVYELIQGLKNTGLIDFLKVQSDKSTIKLRKKVKIYFSHPTLRHAILKSAGSAENIGAYREEFFFHHLKFSTDSIGYPKKIGTKEPDFEIRDKGRHYLFEIGKHKEEKKGFINVVDSDKVKYPLYLFGFIKQHF